VCTHTEERNLNSSPDRLAPEFLRLDHLVDLRAWRGSAFCSSEPRTDGIPAWFCSQSSRRTPSGHPLPSLSRRRTSPGVREPQFQPQTRHRPGVWTMDTFLSPATYAGRPRAAVVGAVRLRLRRAPNVHAEQASSSDLTMMRQRQAQLANLVPDPSRRLHIYTRYNI
jgi:hypothetical protein